MFCLKSGRKISLTKMPMPRSGHIVNFTFEEWAYMKAQNFSFAHRDYLWDKKYADFRYKIIPDADFKTQETGAMVCDEIIRGIK